MISLFKDFTDFIGSLSILDIIFFSTIIILLIISLIIYLFSISKKEIIKKKDTYMEDLLGLMPENDVKEDVVEAISDLPPVDDEPEELLDLATLTQAIENQTFEHIDREKYEREEEEKAIISYDELLENTANYKINYESESEDEGLSVKKVDLNNLATIDDEIPNRTTKVQLVSYEKEEAFLESLKNLKKLLE